MESYLVHLKWDAEVNAASISKAMYDTAVDSGWIDFTAIVTQVEFDEVEECQTVHLDVIPRYLCTNLYFGDPANAVYLDQSDDLA